MKIHEEKYHRAVEIGENIIVKQGVRQMIWEPAFIRCSSTSAMTAHQARVFATHLVEAATIAEQWTRERAGKPC